jgi:hypothetical protein
MLLGPPTDMISRKAQYEWRVKQIWKFRKYDKASSTLNRRPVLPIAQVHAASTTAPPRLIQRQEHNFDDFVTDRNMVPHAEGTSTLHTSQHCAV